MVGDFLHGNHRPITLIYSANQFPLWDANSAFFASVANCRTLSSGGAKLKRRSWESNVNAPKSFLIVDDLARNNKGSWQHTASWQIFDCNKLNDRHTHRYYIFAVFSNSPVLSPLMVLFFWPAESGLRQVTKLMALNVSNCCVYVCTICAGRLFFFLDYM